MPVNEENVHHTFTIPNSENLGILYNFPKSSILSYVISKIVIQSITQKN